MTEAKLVRNNYKFGLSDIVRYEGRSYSIVALRCDGMEAGRGEENYYCLLSPKRAMPLWINESGLEIIHENV